MKRIVLKNTELFTPTQSQIIQSMLDGSSVKTICSDLKIEENTLKRHISGSDAECGIYTRIEQKTGERPRRPGLAYLLLKHNIAQLE